MLQAISIGSSSSGAIWTPYAGVFNASDKATTAVVANNGFLLSSASGGPGGARATVALAGKMYWSVVSIADPGNSAIVGIAPSGMNINTTYNAWSPNGYGYESGGGLKLSTGAAAYGAAWPVRSLVSVAFDADAGTLWFAKNGVWQNSGNPLTGANPAFTGLTGATFYPWCGDITATTVSVYAIAPPGQTALGLL